MDKWHAFLAKHKLEPNIVLVVSGWRGLADQTLVSEKLDDFVLQSGLIPSVVVTGGAKGADALAEHWAKKRGFPVFSFSADWAKHGKAAGPMRNSDLISIGTHIVAFPSKEGRGTQDAIQKAKKKGLMVVVHSVPSSKNESF
jgi:hypothetical protein